METTEVVGTIGQNPVLRHVPMSYRITTTRRKPREAILVRGWRLGRPDAQTSIVGAPNVKDWHSTRHRRAFLVSSEPLSEVSTT